MGACFSVIFHDCPLHVNTTASWANPTTSRHFLMIGAEEGIFSLDMDELHDATMVLIHKRRCSWLHVKNNVLMAVQGLQFSRLICNLLTVSEMWVTDDSFCHVFCFCLSLHESSI